MLCQKTAFKKQRNNNDVDILDRQQVTYSKELRIWRHVPFGTPTPWAVHLTVGQHTKKKKRKEKEINNAHGQASKNAEQRERERERKKERKKERDVNNREAAAAIVTSPWE